MQIIYCHTCGHRIPSAELDSGSVVADDFKHFCAACSAAAAAAADASRVEPQRQSGRSSRKIVLLTPAARKTSGSELPAAPRPPSATHAAAAPHVHPSPARTAPAPLLPVMLGVGLLLLGGIAVFSLTGSKPAPRVANAPDSKSLPTDAHARTSAAPVGPGVPVAPVAPTATPAAPESGAGAPPELNDTERAAGDALQTVLRFDGIPETDTAARRKSLQAFIAQFGESRAAARAQVILMQLHAPDSAPDVAAPPATSKGAGAAARPVALAPRADPNAGIDDRPDEKKLPEKSHAPDAVTAAIAAQTPDAATATNPEREAGAAREFAGLLRLAEARNFKSLDDAARKFTDLAAGTRFNDEHSAELRALAEWMKAPASVEKGLAAWWKFDEASGTTCADSSGNGNTGTLVGPPAWVHGKSGTALNFRSRSEYVVIPNSPTLERLQEGEYSIAAWVKPEELPNLKDTNFSSAAIVMKTGVHEGMGYESHGNFSIDHWLGPNPIACWSFHQYPPGTLHHVVVTVSRAAAAERVYVDGILDGTWTWNAADGPRDYGAETWKIGCAAPQAKSFMWPFKGLVDDVRLYNRVLTPAEAAMLAETPFRKFCPAEPPPSARFVGIDTDTHGTWHGAYGANGACVFGDALNVPASVQISLYNSFAKGYVWSGNTKDIRAPQRTGDNERVAACWFADNSLTLDINLTDGRSHRIALYCVDFDSQARAAKFEVQDTAGTVLDTRDLPEYAKGKYIIWDLKGHVRIVCRAIKNNFVFSGLFFNQ